VTATPKATAEVTPVPVPTSTTGAATGWSTWVTSLPGGVSAPAYTVESKNQYRDVSYFYLEKTQYRTLIDTVDRQYWTDWSDDSSFCTPITLLDGRAVQLAVISLNMVPGWMV
jgi:hypothetical protein